MNKKTLLVALPIMIALALTGCTDKDPQAPGPSQSSTASALPTYNNPTEPPEGVATTAAAVPSDGSSPPPVVVSEEEAATKKATEDRVKADDLKVEAKAAEEKFVTVTKEATGSDDAARAAEEMQTYKYLADEAEKAAAKSAADAATKAGSAEEKK